MRVLHVSAYFAPAFVYGGPPRSILGLCAALARSGVRVDVMTTTANGAQPSLPAAVDRPIDVDGVQVRYFPLAAPRRLWRAPALAACLRREITSYDVVHIHGLWHLPAWHAARTARSAGVPYIISPRGMLEPEALAISRTRKAVAFRLVEGANLAAAALLHATSPREAETLDSRRFGPPVVMIPNGVDIDRASASNPTPVLDEFGIGRDRYVLFLGRLHPIKRLDLLAGALALLRTRGVTMVVAGPDEGEHRRAIEPLFAQAGVRTIWTGAVDDRQKAALLSAARALVQCSDSESFGLSVAEAMAAGTPVVTTQTCPWEEVERVGAGFWVPQTPPALAAAIDRLLDDDVAARQMGAAGRALVARKYDWPANARLLAAEYERLTTRHGTRRPSHVA